MKIDYASNKPFQCFWANARRYEKNSTANKPISPKKNHSKAAVGAAALFGAALPVLAINLAKGKGENFKDVFLKSGAKNKLRIAGKIIKIENPADIIASAAGSIGASVMVGAHKDKNAENKKAKYKEGIFEFLNITIPTAFVAAGENFLKKHYKQPGSAARIATVGASVMGGMFLANKTSNKINQKCFSSKDNRGFKPADCLAHIDDILGLLVLAKVPLADKIHADKILLFLYARSGFEAGDAKQN